VAQGSCGATNFTITVSNGVARDCGGWLANGTLTSSGAYSGLYVGVCGSGGITVSGNLSSRMLQGVGVCRGNTYTVAITLTKQ
jgi:hypothetical protein